MNSFYIFNIKNKFLKLFKKNKIEQNIIINFKLKNIFLFQKFHSIKRIKKIKFNTFKRFKLIKTYNVKTNITFKQLIKTFNIKQKIEKTKIDNIFNLYSNNNFIKNNKESILKYFDLLFNSSQYTNNVNFSKTKNDLIKFLNYIDSNNIKDINSLIDSLYNKIDWMC